jgi:hypothetical protein
MAGPCCTFLLNMEPTRVIKLPGGRLTHLLGTEPIKAMDFSFLKNGSRFEASGFDPTRRVQRSMLNPQISQINMNIQIFGAD